VRAARAGAPDHAAAAVAALLTRTAPQLERTVTMWLDGRADTPAGDRARLLRAIREHLVASLPQCRADSDHGVRTWISVRALEYLIRHAAAARAAARRAAPRGPAT
jgi:hypothetical protein